MTIVVSPALVSLKVGTLKLSAEDHGFIVSGFALQRATHHANHQDFGWRDYVRDALIEQASLTRINP